MAGSIRLKDHRPNVWELRIYVGRDSTGRVRYRQATFHGTRRQAERELARLVAEQESALAAVPEEPLAWGPTTTVNDAMRRGGNTGGEIFRPRPPAATRAARKTTSANRSAASGSTRLCRRCAACPGTPPARPSLVRC